MNQSPDPFQARSLVTGIDSAISFSSRRGLFLPAPEVMSKGK